MADDLAAMYMSFHLAVTELVLVVWPLEGVMTSWQFHPVATHHIMINHKAQSKEYVALKRSK